jgi:hypothetical protein
VSTAAELAGLAERIEEFGVVAYLITVGDDGRPHVVSVRVVWDNGDLVVGAGRHTLVNVEKRPEVTLLWPAHPGSGYGLIVDGTAAPIRDAEPALAIAPTSAVLHRTPEGDLSSPSCITLLPRP